MAAGKQNIRRNRVVLLHQIDGLVGVTIKNRLLQFAMLFEFMAIAVRDHLGKVPITKSTLVQLLAEIDQDGRVTRRNQCQVKFAMVLFLLGRGMSYLDILALRRAAQPVKCQHDALFPV